MMWLLPIVASSALVTPALDAQPPDSAKSMVKLTVVPRDTKVKPGDTVQVGLVLDVAKDWHIYWPGQNESGTPTIVTLSFPPDSGLTAGAVTFPVPKRLALPGDILDYVMEGKVVITVPVKVPATAVMGRKIAITAKVEYLVCHDSCMPGENVESANIIIADKTDGKDSSAKTIDDARAAQPKPQAEGFDAAVTAKWEGEGAAQTLVLTAKDAAVTKVTFYPASGAAKLLDPSKAGQAKGNTLRLTFDPKLKPVEGVVELTSGNTTKAWAFHSSRPQPTAPAQGAPAADPAPKPAAETPAPASPTPR